MQDVLKRIYDYSLEDIMGERFGRYSKTIIQDRALPDVRDGLKPVQRRILYTMYQGKNTYDKPYRKSAKTVGDVMGQYHPHGDSSIYEAMVRMSQWWKQNTPYIDMHGNNGSMDGDSPAAYRYTEARLAKISNELLKDINKDTVIMTYNYDDTLFVVRAMQSSSFSQPNGRPKSSSPHRLRNKPKALTGRMMLFRYALLFQPFSLFHQGTYRKNPLTGHYLQPHIVHTALQQP